MDTRGRRKSSLISDWRTNTGDFVTDNKNFMMQWLHDTNVVRPNELREKAARDALKARMIQQAIMNRFGLGER